MKIDIKHRFTNTVLYSHECENNTLKITVETAVKAGARLDGARLRDASLTGARLDGETLTKTPIQVITNIWPVLITEGYMRIGCQRHSHGEWAAFDEGDISAMDSKALDFWREWKTNMLNICKQHKGV